MMPKNTQLQNNSNVLTQLDDAGLNKYYWAEVQYLKLLRIELS